MKNFNDTLHAFQERISLMDIVGIILGSLIIACAIQFVIVPAQLLTGGISGIAIILHFVSGFPIWVWYIGFNIPVFIAGYRLVSKRFALYSLLGMLTLAFFLAILANFKMNLNIDDIILSALLGGIVNGLGIGVTLRSRGSSGGLDIVAAIVHRYWGFPIGVTIFYSNMIVLAIYLITSNINLTLYTAMTMFVSSKVVDGVNTGPDAKKTIMIVSNRSEDIARAIMQNIKRGCTYIHGRGAYTGNQENIIMVTTGKTQVPRLKEMIFQIDPNAFITITDTVEVYGKGFKSSSTDY